MNNNMINNINNNIMNNIIMNIMMNNNINSKIVNNNLSNNMNNYNMNNNIIFNYNNNMNNIYNKMSQNINQMNFNNDILNLNFRESSIKKNILIKCLPSEKISKIIQYYRVKANDYDEAKRFIFNAKELNPNLTARESQFLDNCTIFIVKTKEVT
jgi:hypothetical protein